VPSYLVFWVAVFSNSRFDKRIFGENKSNKFFPPKRRSWSQLVPLFPQAPRGGNLKAESATFSFKESISDFARVHPRFF
jgi:hypothetical protein